MKTVFFFLFVNTIKNQHSNRICPGSHISVSDKVGLHLLLNDCLVKMIVPVLMRHVQLKFIYFQ